MANDYIYREDAVSRISDLLIFELHMTRCTTWNEVYNAIGELPSADVVQMRHGKWTHKPDVHGVVYCSECDYELHINATNFCPNCGAKMDGGHRIEYPDIGDEIMTQEGRAVIYSVRNGYVFYFNYNKTYNAVGVDKAKNVRKTGRKFPDYKKCLERMRAEQE